MGCSVPQLQMPYMCKCKHGIIQRLMVDTMSKPTSKVKRKQPLSLYSCIPSQFGMKAAQPSMVLQGQWVLPQLCQGPAHLTLGGEFPGSIPDGGASNVCKAVGPLCLVKIRGGRLWSLSQRDSFIPMGIGSSPNWPFANISNGC